MQKLTRGDILDIAAYEKIRTEFRTGIVELKKHRRLPVGPNITVIFENRETVRFQIQEMLRIEKITDENKIRHELETYNALIPGDNELSASLMIEVDRRDLIKPLIDTMVGLEKDCVFLRAGKHLIPALFDEAQHSEFRISAVQYVRFPFTPQQIHEFRNFEQQAMIVVNHTNYKYDSEIPISVRTSLIEDFGVE